MERLAFLRTLYRSAALRSAAAHRCGAITITDPHLSNALTHHIAPPSFQFHRTFFSLSPSTNRARYATGYRPLLMVGGIRSFCEDTTHSPVITDPDVLYVFKDIMAASWDELPNAVISDVKKALAKNTEDKAGQEALANLFRAAEAAEEFGGILVSLRMAIDDSVGLSGENVKPMPDEFANALQVVYKRYTEYLDTFGPEETYLRKKVETELGTKMIHLKMRCSGLGSEWGKVTVLGTSGLSGSYVEQRAS
ncbi:hypothetical protein Sjap_022391 [Stephania japonica]|uniref:Succinate dehydrogenase subunit 5, mitochondrial n=1 Tax=Stephania japonica TaxID=461633 RepID=A0AAP0EXM3_9MAGN